MSDFFASIWQFINYPILVFGKNSITSWMIISNILVVVAFLVIITKVRNWFLKSISLKKGVNVSNWRAAVTLSYYAFLLIGLVGLLQTAGLDLSLFTVLTGAIGIGVGFGMQSIFSNFIGGIIILLEKPLKLGDRIDIGQVSGNVHSISVRATTIITNDNVSVIVPNSDFISKEVINWSHSGNNVRITVTVSVAYDSDPELVERLLLEVAANEPGVLKEPLPAVRLIEFGESSLKFSLLVWTQVYNDNKGALKSLLNFGILKAFKAGNVRIPYPQRDLHIFNEPLTEKTQV